jgi:fumarylpyruvate hydrolase
MNWVIPPPPQPFVLTDEGGHFPVGRIFCVGQNYAEHAREMGSERAEPFFFCKSAHSLVRDGQFPYPSASEMVHHEVELVVALQAGGSALSPEEAKECIWGYAVGLDMTRRDLQNAAKKAGRPWESGKAFEHSAPCGRLSRRAPQAEARITFHCNGQLRQQGQLDHMIWSVEEIVVRLSQLFEVRAGDLIFTGTPAGVGKVRPGDQLVGRIEGLEELVVKVV